MRTVGKRSHRSKRWLELVVAFCLSLIVGVMLVHDVKAQGVSQTQAAVIEIEAAYLYKFANYVDWPAQAFQDPMQPIVIGILNSDRLAEELQQLTPRRRVKGRSFVIRRVKRGDDLSDLHMLFIGPLERAGEKAVLASVRGKPVLTVSDSRRVFTSGSMIHFAVIDQRVRFEVALLPLSRSGIRLSALMLTAASEVHKDEP